MHDLTIQPKEGALDQVYLNGESGDDANDGASAGQAVKTFERAKQLAAPGADLIISGQVDVTANVTLDGFQIKRYNNAGSFPLFWIENGGVLTLRNVKLHLNPNSMIGYSYTGGTLNLQGGVTCDPATPSYEGMRRTNLTNDGVINLSGDAKLNNINILMNDNSLLRVEDSVPLDDMQLWVIGDSFVDSKRALPLFNLSSQQPRYRLNIKAPDGKIEFRSPARKCRLDGNWYAKGGATVELTAVPDAGWTFQGWTSPSPSTANPTTYTMPDAGNSAEIVAEFLSPPAPKITIQFYAMVGPERWAVVKTENLNPGQDATPPAEEELFAPEGMKFAGWEGDYKNVQYDHTITAEYEPVKPVYTVRFVDHDGALLKEEEVEAGKDATPPPEPAREGYVFQGWEGDYKNVRADVTVKARYEKRPEGTKKALRICIEDQPYEVLELGIPKAVTVAAYDADGNKVKVAWSSDSKKVTTKKKSESRYKVKAYKAGTATITATAADGRYGEMTVITKKPSQAVTSGKLNEKEKALEVGEEYQLQASLKPKTAQNKRLIWLSTNEQIATVDQSGKVRAVGPGRVAIKAWTATGIKLKCMVTVK